MPFRPLFCSRGFLHSLYRSPPVPEGSWIPEEVLFAVEVFGRDKVMMSRWCW